MREFVGLCGCSLCEKLVALSDGFRWEWAIWFMKRNCTFVHLFSGHEGKFALKLFDDLLGSDVAFVFGFPSTNDGGVLVVHD